MFQHRGWRFAWILLLLLPGLLVWDFFRFLSAYHHYHDRALAGVEQLTEAPVPDEVIVVLTGDIGRIPRALELLRARGSQRLLIAGAARGVSLAELVSQQGASAENLQTLWKKITVESASSSTIENALFTRPLLEGKNVQRLILVTSDYHLSRSMKVFGRVFPDKTLVPFAVPSTMSGRHSLHFLWKIGSEYWKSLIYRLSLRLGVNV